ncbi:MAG TPA: transposase [Thermodesulfobacteriota bacterium]|nr:transposase [Thermodesulfobacteriota bacterium]
MNRQSGDYAASKKICAACPLREQCAKNKSGRTIKRHLRQEDLDGMREAIRSAKVKRDIKMRQHLMERSYARGTWHGFDRVRWRGLWRVQIREHLVSAVQTIQVLLRYGSYLKASPSAMIEQMKGAMRREIKSFLDYTELMISKIGPRVLFGFIYPSLSFIEG